MLTHDKSSHGLWPGELKKKMAKILKLPLKIYIRIVSIIPISIQVLLHNLIFPVYKIDREQSEKNVSKERLKIPKRYSEAIVFENCLKD
jgi:hypothetical protein